MTTTDQPAGPIPDDELELDDDIDFGDDEESMQIELVVLDMAGTTVRDDGLVLQAFELAVTRTGALSEDDLGWARQYVIDTMGQSKIDVFRAMLDGEAEAKAANAEFERAYVDLIEQIGVDEIEGAEDVIEELKDAGAAVVLTTGFSPTTRDAILESLGWGDLPDFALSPADVGRGRPAPDMVLTAMLRTETAAVSNIAVVGDTRSDIESGLRAGAGLVVGVLTGAHTEEDLRDAGAHIVIESIAELPAVLGLRE